MPIVTVSTDVSTEKRGRGRPKKLNKIFKDLNKNELPQNSQLDQQTQEEPEQQAPVNQKSLKKDLTYDQTKYIKLLSAFLNDYRNELVELADFQDAIAQRLHLTRRFEVSTEIADLRARAMSIRRFIDNTQTQLGIK